MPVPHLPAERRRSYLLIVLGVLVGVVVGAAVAVVRLTG